MGSPRDNHMKEFRRRKSYDKNWKKRKGGMNPKAGMRMWANNHDRKKWEESQSIWEAAAYEMGMGNIKSKKDMEKVKKKAKDLGIKNMDSMNDARQFRKKIDEKKIEEMFAKKWDSWISQQDGAGWSHPNDNGGTPNWAPPGADAWGRRGDDNPAMGGGGPGPAWGSAGSWGQGGQGGGWGQVPFAGGPHQTYGYQSPYDPGGPATRQNMRNLQWTPTGGW